MSLRNSMITEVVIFEGLNKKVLAKKILEITNKHIVIDLQYAVSKRLFGYKHHVILLIQRKHK